MVVVVLFTAGRQRQSEGMALVASVGFGSADPDGEVVVGGRYILAAYRHRLRGCSAQFARACHQREGKSDECGYAEVVGVEQAQLVAECGKHAWEEWAACAGRLAVPTSDAVQQELDAFVVERTNVHAAVQCVAFDVADVGLDGGVLKFSACVCACQVDDECLQIDCCDVRRQSLSVDTVCLCEPDSERSDCRGLCAHGFVCDCVFQKIVTSVDKRGIRSVEICLRCRL